MKTTEKQETSERFYKHRRNLLLLSSIFLFIVLSGGTINKISLLGAELSFANPSVPIKLIFISMIYMTIKYFQFIFELGGTGFKSAIQTKGFNKIPSIAKRNADSKHRDKNDIPISNYDIIENRVFSFKVVEKIDDENEHNCYDVTLRHVWFEFIKSFISVSIKTTIISEYIVPLVLALAGIYIYLFGNIQIFNLNKL